MPHKARKPSSGVFVRSPTYALNCPKSKLMPTTTTLLQASNEVLRSIGERPLLQMSGNTADRLRDVFRQALRDVEAIHTWDWLYSSINAISWTADTADLGDIQRLFRVSIGDDLTGRRELKYLDPDEYAIRPLVAYTSASLSGGAYTYKSNGKVGLNPYPNNLLSQSRIRFDILATLTVPTSGDAVFSTIPERYLSLVVKRACYLMALRHLDDTSSASYFNSEYEQLTQQYRSNERKTPVKEVNMFKRVRGRR